MATTAKPKTASRKRAATKSSARSRRAKKPAGTRARGEQLVKDARKRGEKLLKDARKRGERVVQDAEKTMENARHQTQQRAARLASNVVEFQKSTFNTSIDALGRLQKRSDKLVRRAVKDATWMPHEGKDVVEEWVSTMERARAEFKKSTDKSFDLVLKYLKRLEKAEHRKTAKKKSSVKKKTARRKTAAKRKPKARTKTKAKAKASTSSS